MMLENALEDARDYLDSAIRKVEILRALNRAWGIVPGQVSRLVNQWFGDANTPIVSNNPTHIATILTVLKQMAKYLENAQFDCPCACMPGMSGYVLNGTNVMNICPVAFEEFDDTIAIAALLRERNDALGAEVMADHAWHALSQLILHEAAHASPASLDDEGYWRNGRYEERVSIPVLNIGAPNGTLDTEDALDNADTYSNFIMQLENTP